MTEILADLSRQLPSCYSSSSRSQFPCITLKTLESCCHMVAPVMSRSPGRRHIPHPYLSRPWVWVWAGGMPCCEGAGRTQPTPTNPSLPPAYLCTTGEAWSLSHQYRSPCVSQQVAKHLSTLPARLQPLHPVPAFLYLYVCVDPPQAGRRLLAINVWTPLWQCVAICVCVRCHSTQKRRPRRQWQRAGYMHVTEALEPVLVGESVTWHDWDR